MPDIDVPRVAKDIANLRMQINALEAAAKNQSIPATVQEARATLRWSAIVIAAALLVSSLLKYRSDSRVERLEKRVEMLEKYHTQPASP